MPFYEKGDVRIRYEEAGSGFPLLVTPGGGLVSSVEVASLCPNAEITVFPWREPPELKARTIAQRQGSGADIGRPCATAARAPDQGITRIATGEAFGALCLARAT
jgi:hypothetical protein